MEGRNKSPRGFDGDGEHRRLVEVILTPQHLLLTLTGRTRGPCFLYARVSGHTSVHPAESPWGPTELAVLVVPYPEVMVSIPSGLPLLWGETTKLLSILFPSQHGAAPRQHLPVQPHPPTASPTAAGLTRQTRYLWSLHRPQNQ